MVLSDADEKTGEYLDIIKNEIAGAERIVSDLLDSVRIRPPQRRRVQAEGLIRASLEKCRIPQKVKVDVRAKTQQTVLVDPLQTRQVFINLINNGVEAMPAGGTLSIESENDPDGRVRFTIRDEGAGIRPGDMGKLFQPLFTTKARGIGLGLVVVKNLTEANKGTIDVESEVGKGTTFTLTLPAAEA